MALEHMHGKRELPPTSPLPASSAPSSPVAAPADRHARLRNDDDAAPVVAPATRAPTLAPAPGEGEARAIERAGSAATASERDGTAEARACGTQHHDEMQFAVSTSFRDPEGS